MALIAPDGMPMMQIGCPTRGGWLGAGNPGNGFTLDDPSEAQQGIGSVWTSDGLPHRISTTSSSSLGWYLANSAFANAATRAVVGLARVDTTGTGYPPRAENTAGTIQFQVSKTLVGGSGLVGGWREDVPDSGSMVIAPGDVIAFCIQLTAKGGTDMMVPGAVGMPTYPWGLPTLTGYISGGWQRADMHQLCGWTFEDGARGNFIGTQCLSTVYSSGTAINSGSAIKEMGNYFKFPFPCRLYGFCSVVSFSSNSEINVYTTPFTSPVSIRRLPIPAAYGQNGYSAGSYFMFSSSVDFDANQEFVIAVKPTTTTSITYYTHTVPNIKYQEVLGLSSNSCYMVTRGTGAFAASNNRLERMNIGAMINAFAHPARSSHILGL